MNYKVLLMTSYPVDSWTLGVLSSFFVHLLHNTLNNSLSSYDSNLFILFGYLVMFSPTFPAASILIGCSIFIEIRGKLAACCLCR